MRKLVTQTPKAARFGTLIKESDKGCVIIVGSILEDLLGQLHDAHIAKTTQRSKNIFKSLSSGCAPLSTFAGKIQIA